MSRGQALLGWIVLGLLAAGAAWGQGQTVGITFEDQAVVATGLTPGKAVVWFGFEYRVDDSFAGDLTERYEVGTAAADGTARLELTAPAAPHSCWLAADLDTGAYALAAPSPSRIAKAPMAPVLDSASGAGSDALVETRPWVIGVLVRPGVGAWAFGAGDGNAVDQDGEVDGHLRIGLDRLTPLTGSPAAPNKAANNDLWLIVDPLTVQVSVLQGGVAQ